MPDIGKSPLQAGSDYIGLHRHDFMSFGCSKFVVCFLFWVNLSSFYFVFYIVSFIYLLRVHFFPLNISPGANNNNSAVKLKYRHAAASDEYAYVINMNKPR